MTALVGVFGAGAATAASSLTALFGRMRNRGAAVPEQFVAPGVLMAARRHDWEADERGWTGPVLTAREDWVVAADASLYYLADLRRQLARHDTASSHAPMGELIVSALRLWGDRFARQIEGDFAIIALHRQSGRVLLARDFCGRRSMAYAVTADRTLVVCSSPVAVVEHPGVSRGFDVDFIAASISGVPGHGPRTAFSSVAVVPGGATLASDAGRLTEVDRWLPPPFSSDWEDDVSDRAAEELRGLIEDAVVERLPERGNAAVWMSGGWDSTSIFAAGRRALAGKGADSIRLIPISLKYPAGDTGDETAYVESVADRWGAEVRWISTNDIPLFEDADRRAAVRDDPRMHPFESQIRAMSRFSRELGVRTVLDGVGGDHLFMVSSAAIMADHVRSGRLAPLWGSWKAWGHRLRRTFFRVSVLPLLSPGALDWIGMVRGRRLRGYLDRELPPWVRPTPELLKQATPGEERTPDEGISAWETREALMNPLVARTLSWNHAMALEEGILLRSPLFDQRIIRFAASRPLNERHAGPDSKVILRHAMRGLIPDIVLEPRSHKTGTPTDYFKRELQEYGAAEFRHVFGSGRSRLEALGVLDLGSLKRAMAEYEATPNHQLGASLQVAVEAERWLAAHELAG